MITPFANMHLTPYGGLLFFIPLLILAIPAIVMGLKGRTSRRYNFWASLLMIYIIFSSFRWQIMINLVYFFIWEWAIIKGYSLLRGKRSLTPIYWGAVIGSLFPLVVVKAMLPSLPYTGFLGISYITFKCVQLIIELHDKLIEQVTLTQFTNFLLFFPTISSGPIDRFRRYMKDWHWIPTSTEYNDLLFRGGIRMVFRGFSYKFILAYFIKTYWMIPVSNSDSVWAIIGYMYAYSLYLFFDFAGYSAFAVGVSYIFAIRTPENFNKPFLSTNIKDFWNRWHITLSYWFRDYVFMRVALFLTKKKLIANKYVIAWIGYFVLFSLMGLWHGIQSYYLVYGLFHAMLMSGFELFDRLNKEWRFWGNGPWWRWLSILITFHCICFGFLIFSGRIVKYNFVLLLAILAAAGLILLIQIIKPSRTRI